MATNTAELTLKQTSTNNENRGAMLRRMLPSLLVNAVVPFTINMLAQPHTSTINALLLASSVPTLYTLGTAIWKKHIDAIGVIVVIDLFLTAIFALLFKSPRLLLLQGSAVSGLFGMVMLVSLFFSKPVLFYIVRSILTQNNAQRVASFNADWSFPQFRAFYRLLTAVWGSVTVANVLLLSVLVFVLPISLMLIVSPVLSFTVIMLTAHWSMYVARKNRRIFEQLRKQRDVLTSIA